MVKEKNIPQCIGIIMDGNRRWARERGLTTFEGHLKGYQKLKEVISWAHEAGVKDLIFYGFSTENWNRSTDEVASLMKILETALIDELAILTKEGVRILFIGDRSCFSQKIQDGMTRAEKETMSNTNGTVTLALSYGGRQEIVNATNALLREGKREINEKDFAEHLSTASTPDPDIIIRPGGEKRLSNFLPWQSTYSELFFCDTYWPDFSKKDFLDILLEFSKRERRHGK